MSVILRPNFVPTPQEQSGLSCVVTQHLNNYFRALNGNAPAPGLYKRILEEMERPLLTSVLQYSHGNNARAAEILGINRNTLRKKIQELGISPKRR